MTSESLGSQQFKFHWEHIVTALFLSSAIAVAISNLVSLTPQKYSQLITGNLAWSLGLKQPDYALLSGFSISFFLTSLGIYQLPFLIERQNEKFAEYAFRQLLIYSLLPSGIFLDKSIANPSNGLVAAESELILLSLILVLLCLVLSAIVAIKRLGHLSTSAYLELVGGSLLYSLFALLVGSSLALAAGRINLTWKLNSSDQIAIVTLVDAILLCLPLARVWWKLTANISEFYSNLRALLWAIQGVFSLFFFILIPTPWFTKGGAFYGYPITLSLLLLNSFVSITHMQWFHRFKLLPKIKATDEECALFRVVLLMCMVALLLFIKAQSVQASTIPLDIYTPYTSS